MRARGTTTSLLVGGAWLALCIAAAWVYGPGGPFEQATTENVVMAGMVLLIIGFALIAALSNE